MSKQKFPPGWDEKRVREVIAHYEGQSEDEQFAEIEAAMEQQDITMMAVPNDLAPEVRALIARRRSA
ncbi:MAG: hypothetical protein FJ291_27525 [Planctomycetes bacterium]|nr:hypothetical protein [Planctomycetota bacterium]